MAGEGAKGERPGARKWPGRGSGEKGGDGSMVDVAAVNMEKSHGGGERGDEGMDAEGASLAKATVKGHSDKGDTPLVNQDHTPAIRSTQPTHPPSHQVADIIVVQQLVL